MMHYQNNVSFLSHYQTCILKGLFLCTLLVRTAASLAAWLQARLSLFLLPVCVSAAIACTGTCEEEGTAKPLCANYTTITDTRGRNALKGVIAYEGYADRKSQPALLCRLCVLCIKLNTCC